MTTAAVARPLTGAELPRRVRCARALGIRAIAVIIGAFAMLVSFAGSWIPSFWGDEAVSIMSAVRPLPSLFAALGRVDAVHGTYYLFLRGWIDLFGASELSLRLPSAIAVGLAAAGTVVLGDLLLTRRIAIIAGIVLAVLPRVTSVGSEARSFALGMAIAVWLTAMLVRLLARAAVGRLAWLAYALVFAVAIYLFLFLVLLAVVHGVLLLSRPRARGVLRRWLEAVGLGVVLAAPVIVWGLAQHHQIAFLAARYQITFETVLVEQWFSGFWLPVVCWALIVLGAVAVIRSGRAGRGGAVLTVAWLVLPTAILLAGNAAIAPMYATRYLAFCAPAAALLIAAGVAALPRARLHASALPLAWLQASVGVLLIALVVPGYLAQRGPYAMDGGSDWRQVSAIVGAHARPGDAVVFGLTRRPSRMPRLAMYAYPDAYRGLNDIELVTAYDRLPGLRDDVARLGTVTARLAATTTVWVVAPLPSDRSGTPADVATLERLGFGLAREFPVHRNGVYELTRRAP